MFFRIPGDEQPLQIYIFRQNADLTYTTQSIVSSDGTAISSVDYENLDDDPDTLELVVSWQVSSRVYNLGAYRYDSRNPVGESLVFTAYNSYTLTDIDRDNQQEIVVFTLDSIAGENHAGLYNYDPGAGSLVLQGNSALSKEIMTITSVYNSYVANGDLSAPAIFVTSEVSNDVSIVTDILTWTDDRLVNLTLDGETGISLSTRRIPSLITPQDIDSDQVLELPHLRPLPQLPTANSDLYWSVQWVQYDITGAAIDVFETYYTDSEGWYLIFPEGWSGHILLDRSNLISGEQVTTFYYWETLDDTTEPQPFLYIYTLTGPNRQTRSRTGSRFALMSEVESTIYAAEFRDIGWDHGLDEESIKEHFHLIRPNWSTSSP